MSDLPRIRVQKTAAAMLRVSPRRLREMTDSPWWVSELRTEEGYDVCGIVIAQLSHSGKSTDDDLRARRSVAETEKIELQREAEELKVWELQLEKEKALANILPADVYQEFIRELLGMIRGRLDEIPYRLSRRATPAQKKLVYVPEKKIKKESDAAPLQREITKLNRDVQKWLDQAETEAKQSA